MPFRGTTVAGLPRSEERGTLSRVSRLSEDPTMRRFVFWGALAITAFLAARPAAADEKKLGDDAKFLKEAISGGMLEVKLGELARDKGMDPDVKKFGERMVTDHSKANKELMALAEKKGLVPSRELMKKHQEAYDKMMSLRGAEFDRAYMRHQVKDHEEDVAEFSKESRDAQDADVKACATKMLPTLKEHLEMARKVAAK